MEKGVSINNAYVELITQQFGQVYFLFNAESNSFRYINPSFSQIWGIDAASVLKNPAALIETVDAEDRAYLMNQYQKLLGSSEQVTLEFRIIFTNQKIKWISLSACVLQDAETAGILVGGFAVDITHKREYMDNLLKYNTKKNSTLEILSHDLAAPFANIQGMINAIEEQVKEGDVQLDQMINFIKEDAMRGSDMIRDFVDNEFLESSEVVLHMERVDIVRRFFIMMDNYKQREDMIAKNFKMEAPDKPLYIKIDENKFMQVMNNLLSNAIKFTNDDGMIIVSVQEQEDTVLITVADNGVGIPEQLQPFLFDRFTKARRLGIRGERSIGLGMSIIKNIVELHKGSVWLESTENVGSTFYIELPKD